MIEVERRIAASPEAVFAVIADGWTYPIWVVGASRIRAVDPSWPEVGSELHHSVGAWPALLDDSSRVLECEPNRRLVLRARGWPVGEAVVDLRLEPDGDGALVTMGEDVSRGPTKFTPKPLRVLGIKPRNVESLRRLAYLAERRTDPSLPD